jgi:hypothetical protein
MIQMSVANIRVTITDSTLRSHLSSIMFDPHHTKLTMGTNVAVLFDETYKPPAWQTDLEFAYLVWLSAHDDTRIKTRVGILAAQQYICFYLGWEMLNKIQQSPEYSSQLAGMERISLNTSGGKKAASSEEAKNYMNAVGVKNLEVANPSLGNIRYPSSDVFQEVLEKIVFRGYMSPVSSWVPFEAVPNN